MPHAPCPMPTAQCSMPHAQCPIPDAPCPLPNAQCPMPAALRERAALHGALLCAGHGHMGRRVGDDGCRRQDGGAGLPEGDLGPRAARGGVARAAEARR
eukprot:scaffold10254_cov45-Phaeocystis_antarctica.AAC.1